MTNLQQQNILFIEENFTEAKFKRKPIEIGTVGAPRSLERTAKLITI